jgi:hypothetical protein
MAALFVAPLKDKSYASMVDDGSIDMRFRVLASRLENLMISYLKHQSPASHGWRCHWAVVEVARLWQKPVTPLITNVMPTNFDVFKGSLLFIDAKCYTSKDVEHVHADRCDYCDIILSISRLCKESRLDGTADQFYQTLLLLQ